MKTVLFCFSRMIHEAHKHTVTVGGHRIHALLQSTFEVRVQLECLRLFAIYTGKLVGSQFEPVVSKNTE